MDTEQKESLTLLLRRWSEGDEESAADALPLVYDELRNIAAGYFRRERSGHTLQATAVVHEVYIQLMEQTGVRWQNRSHFVGRVAQMMRRILVDHAREHNAAKRGGDQQRVTLTEASELTDGRPPDLVALDEALHRLEEVDPRKARLVELRFFGGLRLEETAEILDISRPTVVREWRRTRAWLYRELTASEIPEGGTVEEM